MRRKAEKKDEDETTRSNAMNSHSHFENRLVNYRNNQYSRKNY
jgi:hypothetical protein